MKFSKSGEPLFTVITVKLFAEGNVSYRTFRFKSGPKRGFTDDQVHGVLEDFVARVEKESPSVERRIVQIAPNAFNFVAVEKAAA